MNTSQITSAATTLMVIVGSVLTALVASGKITSEQSSAFSTALQAAIPAILTIAVGAYKLFSHSDAAKVASVNSVPGVKVGVDMTAATEAVRAVANDPKVTNVNPL